MTELNFLLENDVVDTPKEAVDQASKRRELREAMCQGKAYLLPGKAAWTVKKLDKASDEVIESLCAVFKQHEMRDKAEKTGKECSAHVANLYSQGISKVVKIDNIEALRQDIENDPIIKDLMADLGSLMMCTFGKFIAPLLVAAHTLNYIDFAALMAPLTHDKEQKPEEEIRE